MNPRMRKPLKIIFLVFSVLSALFGICNAGKACIKLPSPLVTSKDALLVCGGAMCLTKTKDLACKVATIGAAGTAAVTYLAPAFATKKIYKLPVSHPLVVWLVRAMGGALSMIAIEAFCLFFCKMSQTKVVGYGCLPYMVNEIRTLILNETRQWDMPPWGLLFVSLPISSSCAYTLITEKHYANKVLKSFTYWILVGNGLPLGFAPKIAGKGWGIDMEIEGASDTLRLFGLTNLSAGILMVLLDWDVIDKQMSFLISFALLVAMLSANVFPRMQHKGSGHHP